MTRPEIVERSLQVEQAYADLSQQQVQFQFAWAERELHIEANSSRPHVHNTTQPGVRHRRAGSCFGLDRDD